MTQFEFDVITVTLENGVPAISKPLCTALTNLVNERNSLAKENEELRKQMEEKPTKNAEKHSKTEQSK